MRLDLTKKPSSLQLILLPLVFLLVIVVTISQAEIHRNGDLRFKALKFTSDLSGTSEVQRAPSYRWTKRQDGENLGQQDDEIVENEGDSGESHERADQIQQTLAAPGPRQTIAPPGSEPGPIAGLSEPDLVITPEPTSDASQSQQAESDDQVVASANEDNNPASDVQQRSQLPAGPDNPNEEFAPQGDGSAADQVSNESDEDGQDNQQRSQLPPEPQAVGEAYEAGQQPPVGPIQEAADQVDELADGQGEQPEVGQQQVPASERPVLLEGQVVNEDVQNASPNPEPQKQVEVIIAKDETFTNDGSPNGTTPQAASAIQPAESAIEQPDATKNKTKASPGPLPPPPPPPLPPPQSTQPLQAAPLVVSLAKVEPSEPAKQQSLAAPALVEKEPTTVPVKSVQDSELADNKIAALGSIEPLYSYQVDNDTCNQDQIFSLVPREILNMTIERILSSLSDENCTQASGFKLQPAINKQIRGHVMESGAMLFDLKRLFLAPGSGMIVCTKRAELLRGDNKIAFGLSLIQDAPSALRLRTNWRHHKRLAQHSLPLKAFAISRAGGSEQSNSKLAPSKRSLELDGLASSQLTNRLANSASGLDDFSPAGPKCDNFNMDSGSYYLNLNELVVRLDFEILLSKLNERTFSTYEDLGGYINLRDLAIDQLYLEHEMHLSADRLLASLASSGASNSAVPTVQILHDKNIHYKRNNWLLDLYANWLKHEYRSQLSHATGSMVRKLDSCLPKTKLDRK